MKTNTTGSREWALPYVGYRLTDGLDVSTYTPIPANAVLVGWQCGFEPMFVAVWSYLPDTTLSQDEAVEIACDYLQEINWFAEQSTGQGFNGDADNFAIEPDYIIGGTI